MIHVVDGRYTTVAQKVTTNKACDDLNLRRINTEMYQGT